MARVGNDRGGLDRGGKRPGGGGVRWESAGGGTAYTHRGLSHKSS